MKTGLVLSGGGARGLAHLGVIKAFQDLDIKIDMISGTSSGAIVGALYAHGYRAEEILKIILETRFFRSLRPAWAWTGILTLAGLENVLLKYIPKNTFETLQLKMHVAATDIRKGCISYFSEGELIRPILASCSVPAVFNPVAIEGSLYVDGGIMDNLPVRPIREACDVIVASHCNHIGPNFDPRNLRNIIERSLLIAVNGNTAVSKTMCDVLIEPPDLSRFSGFDIKRGMDIFTIGYEYTMTPSKIEEFKKVGIL